MKENTKLNKDMQTKYDYDKSTKCHKCKKRMNETYVIAPNQLLCEKCAKKIMRKSLRKSASGGNWR